ncbi:MAG: MotA/TolQ/ExbB proton channel family protein [Eubacteriales bacterium]|nr:MotA/TolQ/ExbB proton channel family protein [Eubacteriales bacterium]
MKRTAYVGFIIGMVFTIYGIFNGGSMMNFYDVPSLYIVFGGTLGAVIMGSSPGSIKNFFKVLKIAFSARKEDGTEVITKIIELSLVARRDGLLALENESEALTDEFFKKGVQLAVDGMASEVIRDVMYAEIDAMEQRHKDNRSLFDLGANIAPAFGMIGTLIGLINMLQHLTSPEDIGPQMSIALVTTFYGSMLSNLFFIPISKKLKAKTDEEIKIREIIIEGVISIQSGENTRFTEQKLISYLTPKEREALKRRKENE